jgi:hypothetical protein
MFLLKRKHLGLCLVVFEDHLQFVLADVSAEIRAVLAALPSALPVSAEGSISS